MGSNHIKHNRVKQRINCFINDTRGDVMVEATVLFPIMIMVFAALVLLAVYLPSQAVLQRAAQQAATALAAEISDTWLFYDADEDVMSYYWETDKEGLTNVYAKLFQTDADYISAKAGIITENIESSSISSKTGRLTVICSLDDKIIYKEVIVEAVREYEVPVNLSFIGFPETITVAASSVAVVQNCDEFVRNIDIATDFAQYVIDKFELNDLGDSIGSFGSTVRSLLGW